MTQLTELGDPNLVLGLEPEELAPVILRYLENQTQPINRYNFSLVSPVLAAQLKKELETSEKLMEAWMVLEREGFVAPKPGMQGDWAFVTSKGKKVVSEQDFRAYKKPHFPRWLDPVLIRSVSRFSLAGITTPPYSGPLRKLKCEPEARPNSPQTTMALTL